MGPRLISSWTPRQGMAGQSRIATAGHEGRPSGSGRSNWRSVLDSVEDALGGAGGDHDAARGGVEDVALAAEIRSDGLALFFEQRFERAVLFAGAPEENDFAGAGEGTLGADAGPAAGEALDLGGEDAGGEPVLPFVAARHHDFRFAGEQKLAGLRFELPRLGNEVQRLGSGGERGKDQRQEQQGDGGGWSKFHRVIDRKVSVAKFLRAKFLHAA